ncbi:hypothetical protein EON63_22140 [archaeon]|nr:MAG: hypothetical protein EON63_22140 [archaeon]
MRVCMYQCVCLYVYVTLVCVLYVCMCVCICMCCTQSAQSASALSTSMGCSPCISGVIISAISLLRTLRFSVMALCMSNLDDVLITPTPYLRISALRPMACRNQFDLGRGGRISSNHTP